MKIPHLFFWVSSVFSFYTHACLQAPASYWLWAGQGYSSRFDGQTVYLHQGLLRRDGNNLKLIKQGLSPFKTGSACLIIVFRAHSDAWDEAIVQKMLFIIEQWQASGNQVGGVQIDYDAATAKLPQYAKRLRVLRQLLPSTYRLSITGLGDWVLSGAPTEVQQTVDEVVFQLYDRSDYVPALDAYVTRLSRLKFAFKIGLLDQHSKNAGILRGLRASKLTGVVYFKGKLR